MNRVQDWAERHQETLEQGLQQPVRALDLGRMQRLGDEGQTDSYFHGLLSLPRVLWNKLRL